MCGGRVWLQLCGSGGTGLGGREGGREQGTGPRAAGPEERVAVPEKDELVSARPERRVFFASLAGYRDKSPGRGRQSPNLTVQGVLCPPLCTAMWDGGIVGKGCPVGVTFPE